MQNATARNKSREYQSEIMGLIAAKGATNVARMVGVHKSQITRWQSEEGGFVEKASRLLAVIGFRDVVVKTEETSELAGALIAMLEHIREPKKG